MEPSYNANCPHTNQEIIDALVRYKTEKSHQDFQAAVSFVNSLTGIPEEDLHKMMPSKPNYIALAFYLGTCIHTMSIHEITERLGLDTDGFFALMKRTSDIPLEPELEQSIRTQFGFDEDQLAEIFGA